MAEPEPVEPQEGSTPEGKLQESSPKGDTSQVSTPEEEPEPPKAKTHNRVFEKKPPGRPKKEPGAPKAKYAPRKPKVPEVATEVVREAVRERPREPDEAQFARQVASNIGQISRDHFQARRDGWRALVAGNYQ